MLHRSSLSPERKSRSSSRSICNASGLSLGPAQVCLHRLRRRLQYADASNPKVSHEKQKTLPPVCVSRWQSPKARAEERPMQPTQPTMRHTRDPINQHAQREETQHDFDSTNPHYSGFPAETPASMSYTCPGPTPLCLFCLSFFLLLHLCFVSCAASLYLSKMSHMYELSALSRELWMISVTLALFRRPNLLISPQVRG